MSNSARNHYNPNALQVKALYDYVPDASFDGKYLSFKTGDVITVTEKCEGGWYKGLLNNIEGLFPPTYCEELAPRRLMNIDTKKASPTIKRMQTLLKLTVTGTGEQVEEYEQEAQGDGQLFTRERAQSDARVFTHSASSGTAKHGFREVAQKIIEGKRLLEAKMAGGGREEDTTENGVISVQVPAEAAVVSPPPPASTIIEPVLRIVEPLVKEKPNELPEVSELKKRISELEIERTVSAAEYLVGKERLQDEFLLKIASLNDLLDEKTLIIEIMKKDLEIKAEENKEITIELELEIERLTQACSSLSDQVSLLTPLDPTLVSPRDHRAYPVLPKSHNPPSPSPRRKPRSTPHQRPANPTTTSSSPSPQRAPSPTPTDTSSTPSETSASSPAPSAPSSPSPTVSGSTTPSPSPPTFKRSQSAFSFPVHSTTQQEFATSSSETVSPPSKGSPKPALRISTSTIASDQQPQQQQQALSSSITIPTPHQPPLHQRFNSLPTLSPLPKDSSGRGPTSPRMPLTITSSTTLIPPITPRAPTTPRVLYSSSLLPLDQASDSKSKIPNLDENLTKLVGMGPHPHPPPPPLELGGGGGGGGGGGVAIDPAQAAVEIADLKKKIAELEEERLQMIEEYRHKKAAVAEPPPSVPGTPTTVPPLPFPPGPLSASGMRAITPPLPPVPTLQFSTSLTKSSTLPPVPLPPTSSTTSSSVVVSPPLSSSQPLPKRPASPPSPLTSSSSTQVALSSSTSSPSTATTSSPPSSSSQPPPPRTRKRSNKNSSKNEDDDHETSNTTTTNNNNKENKDSKSIQNNNNNNNHLTWIQASACVALGSVAFYLVQSIVYTYYLHK